MSHDPLVATSVESPSGILSVVKVSLVGTGEGPEPFLSSSLNLAFLVFFNLSDICHSLTTNPDTQYKGRLGLPCL